MRHVVVMGLGLMLVGTLGCESAEQKCTNARTAALNEWDAYLQVLEDARAKAIAEQKMVGLKLMGIDQRIAPRARARADARFPPGSDAWLRANTSAHNDLCGEDPECRAVRERRFQANMTIEDLDERLRLARAARDAAHGDAKAAMRAAAAVLPSPEHPQLKQAQALSDALAERCAGLPADAVSSVQR